jgi:SpoVK/Ycf46/Vps4 family AAA+-type ATPase
MEFAIHHLATQKRWADIVLNAVTLEQIGLLRGWLHQHKHIIGVKNKLRDGYHALFYGPAGTGKSLTAAILANEVGADVYKIDLSLIISKYIGETEKNLGLLFDKAGSKGWILFFDESDALFGKRTGVTDSHDRYANQETSYLMQRIEQHKGLTIISSNLKSNIDPVFMRRLHSVIHFPLPTAAERKRIWEAGFSEKQLDLGSIDINLIAEQYELSPASIMNVVHCLSDAKDPKGESIVNNEMVIEQVRHEYKVKTGFMK